MQRMSKNRLYNHFERSREPETFEALGILNALDVTERLKSGFLDIPLKVIITIISIIVFLI